MGRQDGEQVLDEIRAIVFTLLFFSFTINAGLRAMALLEQP